MIIYEQQPLPPVSSIQQERSLQKLRVRLSKIEQQLDKVRCVSVGRGMHSAKASRSWDILAQEKFQIMSMIQELESMDSIH